MLELGKKIIAAGMISTMLLATSTIVTAEEPVKCCGENEILCLIDHKSYYGGYAKYFDCNGNPLGDISYAMFPGFCYTIDKGTYAVSNENNKQVVYYFGNDIQKAAEISDENLDVFPIVDGYVVRDTNTDHAAAYDVNGSELWTSDYFTDEDKWDLVDQRYDVVRKTVYRSYSEDGCYIPYKGSITNPVMGYTNTDEVAFCQEVDGKMSVSTDNQTFCLDVNEGEIIQALNDYYYITYGSDGADGYCHRVRDLNTGEEVFKSEQMSDNYALGEDFLLVSHYSYDGEPNYTYEIYLPDGTDIVEKYKITGQIEPYINNMLYVRRGPYMGLMDLEGNWIIKTLAEPRVD